jgi:hypothetical protein
MLHRDARPAQASATTSGITSSRGPEGTSGNTWRHDLLRFAPRLFPMSPLPVVHVVNELAIASQRPSS